MKADTETRRHGDKENTGMGEAIYFFLSPGLLVSVSGVRPANYSN
jgi:hypothetical protein